MENMSRTMFLSFCILLNVLLVRGQLYTPVIETAFGPVRGTISSTIENIDYAAFKGIPYAKPPIKYLRFKPPVKIDAWTEVYDAITEGNMCPQFNPTVNSVVGSEDCLYINVFTPHTEFSDLIVKPVMVWIYGGAFTNGNSYQSLYGPDFILKEDVIMVSFNYRVSALGFLNLEHESATGNCGLKDQNLALKWVKENIARFGGNPDNITIFGQSAGSVSVDLHVLSDMSVDLFKQSISMSGSTLCMYWGFQSGTEAVEQAFLLGSKLGINTAKKDILLKALYAATADEIIVAANNMGLIPFRPSLEKIDIATDQEKFLTECSLTKYITGNYTKGPHIMGFTMDETVSFGGSINNSLKLVEATLSSIGSEANNIPFFSNLRNAINTGSEDLTLEDIYELIKQTTDLYFVLGIDTKQQLISRNNDYPIYYYRFSFNSNDSLHRAANIDFNGVGHGDELPYIFYMPLANIPLYQPDIATTRKRMVKLWTNFAKYGNPTPNKKVLGFTWPDSRPSGAHLEIDEYLTIRPRPTDIDVRSLQLTGLGASPVLNDCAKNSLADAINSAVSVISLIG